MTSTLKRTIRIGVPIVLVVAAIAFAANWLFNDPAGDLYTVIANADEVVYYEGLPHWAFQEALFKEERKSKNTIEIDRHLFYAEPLSLSDSDAKTIAGLLGSADLYRTYRPEKCDFHADYAVEFHRRSEKYTVQICFGCDEIRVIAGRDMSRYTMDSSIEQELKTRLTAYYKNRPADTRKERLRILIR